MIQEIALTGILLVLIVLAPCIYSSRIKGLMKLFLVHAFYLVDTFYFKMVRPLRTFFPVIVQNKTTHENMKLWSLVSLKTTII